MGRNRNIRLTEKLEADVEQYLTDNETNFTALVIEGVTSIIYKEARNGACHDKPDPEIVVPAPSEEAEKPAVTPETPKALPNGYIPKSAAELREAYKSTHPMDICPTCHQFNNACTCGSTVYEPDPVKVPRKSKGKGKKEASPVVQALLSGVVRPPLHAHHPACTCGVCRVANE